jgi:outer membrane protein
MSQSVSDIWNLKKCIDTSVKNNLTIRQAAQQLNTSRITRDQAKMNLLPTASLTTPVGVQFGRSINPITNGFTSTTLIYQNYGLSGNLPLLNWGKLKDQVKAQSYTMHASELNISKTENEIALTVAQDYLQALLAKEQVKNARIQLELTRKQLDIAKLRFVADKLSELDLAQLRAQFASDSINMLTQEGAYANNILILKALINISLSQPFEIEDIATDDAGITGNDGKLMNEGAEAIYQMALQNLPQSRIHILKIQAAQSYIKAAHAAMFPALSVNYTLASTFSNYTTNQPFRKWWSRYGFQMKADFYQQLALTLNVPIFENSHLRNALRQSRLDLRSAELEAEQDNLQLRENIYTVYSTALFALRKAEEGRIMVEDSQKAYDLTLKGFEIGSKDAFTLITSENSLLKAKEQQLINQYDYLFRINILGFYRYGQLVPEL